MVYKGCEPLQSGFMALAINESPTVKKKPPVTAEKSVQFDLFKQFVTNNEAEVSNTVELWDTIPKYFFTPHLARKLRNQTGHADPYDWKFSHQGQDCTIRIQPAMIEQPDGTFKAFFPSVTEELVEEALKKIMTDQNYGLHSVDRKETWVRFTLRMIRKELKARGRSRSVMEIRHAIEVMSQCVLIYMRGGKAQWKGAILQDLVTVDRDEYRADTDAHHIARLPLFITHSICLLYTSPSPRDKRQSRMPSSA